MTAARGHEFSGNGLRCLKCGDSRYAHEHPVPNAAPVVVEGEVPSQWYFDLKASHDRLREALERVLAVVPDFTSPSFQEAAKIAHAALKEVQP